MAVISRSSAGDRGTNYPTVLRDGGKVRCYYRAWNQPTDHHAAVTCLAETPDGVTFHKPALGLYDVGGNKQNNVILTCEEDMYTHNFAPFIDTRPGSWRVSPLI